MEWQESTTRLLALGNPPWVTISELSSIGSVRVPERTNIRAKSGLDAITGASNFDVAEYIFLRLLTELPTQTEGNSTVIAMLIKTSVARRVIEFLGESERVAINSAHLWRIDAKKHFDVAVDACLFAVELDGPLTELAPGVIRPSDVRCETYESLEDSMPGVPFGVSNGELVANLNAWEVTRAFDGACQIEWRQGVKHDASKIMELRDNGDGLRNGLGEPVDVEAEFLFPLLKCSDLHNERRADGKKMVIVPQRHTGDDTTALRHRAPKLWAYLDSHREHFAKRKSSIYQNRPAFSIFGVGPYTFAPWKVAISGLHKTPNFQLVGPVDNQPVCFDDTCYLLPFSDETEARAAKAVFESKPAQLLMSSLLFTDSKRPVTKRLLKRFDLAALLNSGEVDVDQKSAAALRKIWEGEEVDKQQPLFT